MNLTGLLDQFFGVELFPRRLIFREAVLHFSGKLCPDILLREKLIQTFNAVVMQFLLAHAEFLAEHVEEFFPAICVFADPADHAVVELVLSFRCHNSPPFSGKGAPSYDSAPLY